MTVMTVLYFMFGMPGQSSGFYTVRDSGMRTEQQVHKIPQTKFLQQKQRRICGTEIAEVRHTKAALDFALSQCAAHLVQYHCFTCC